VSLLVTLLADCESWTLLGHQVGHQIHG
jgi:hypothetical protein